MAIKLSPNRKVNSNPRPPNEPKFGLAKAQPAKNAIGIANNKKAVNSTRISQNKSLGSKGSSVNQSPTSSSPLPAPSLGGADDPRDAQYWESLASLEFNKNKELENLQTLGTYDKTGFDREKSQLDYLSPIEQRKLRENANVGGRTYSTSTQEELGNLGIEQSYKQSSLQEAFQKLLFERAMQKQGVEGNYNTESRNTFNEAVQRATQRASEREAPELPQFNFEVGPGVTALGEGKTQTKSPQKAAMKKKIGISQAKKAR